MTRFREWAKPRFQDFAMRLMDDLRPETVNEASGDVLEIGFGTGRNLKHYADDVESVHGIDPLGTQGVRLVEERTGVDSSLHGQRFFEGSRVDSY